MNLFKKKSFTIIEIMVVIMIVSIFSITIVSGLSYFQQEAITQNNIKKIKIIEKDFIKIFSFRKGSFLFKDRVPYMQDGNSITDFYPVGVRTPIYKEDTTTNLTINSYANFWKTSANNLNDFANKPLDIIIESKYFDYYTTVPYKNIFVISWGRLNSYKSWDSTLKDLFFTTDLQGNFIYNSYAGLDTAGKSLVDAWLSKYNLDLGFLNKEINYIKINNMEIMKNEIKVTIEKINKIESNLKYWVTSQIRSVSGTGSMPGKDFFIFKKSDGNSDSLATNGSSSNLKASFLDNLISTTTDNKDIDLANVFSFIDNSQGDGEYSRYITTLPFETTCQNLTMGLDSTHEFTFKGLAPLDESYISCEPSQLNGTTAKYTILSSTKRIMGIISNIDGRESISGFPLFIANDTSTSTPTIEFTNFDGVSNSFGFSISSPQIVGSSYKVPPYNLVIVAVFPWVLDGNFTDSSANITAGIAATDTYNLNLAKLTSVYYNSFGFYSKKIYSVSSGI